MTHAGQKPLAAEAKELAAPLEKSNEPQSRSSTLPFQSDICKRKYFKESSSLNQRRNIIHTYEQEVEELNYVGFVSNS